jgi:Ca2+-binding EF-hand superfamily protein
MAVNLIVNLFIAEDGDGELDVEELIKVFGALNVQAKKEEVIALFKELDKSMYIVF